MRVVCQVEGRLELAIGRLESGDFVQNPARREGEEVLRMWFLERLHLAQYSAHTQHPLPGLQSSCVNRTLKE